MALAALPHGVYFCSRMGTSAAVAAQPVPCALSLEAALGQVSHDSHTWQGCWTGLSLKRGVWEPAFLSVAAAAGFHCSSS